MLGWVVWKEQGGTPRVERCHVNEVPFWKLEGAAPHSVWQRWLWRRGLRQLQRLGVRSVAAQGPVPPELLKRFFLRPVDPAPLRLALLPQLLDYVQSTWQIPLHQTAVRLCSRQADTVVEQAAHLLAQRVRYLHLEGNAGQDSLARQLQWRYGLAGGGAAPSWEVCIGCQGSGEVPAIHLGEECAQRQKVEMNCEKIPQADEQLLAALFQAGKPVIEEIRIKSVEFFA